MSKDVIGPGNTFTPFLYRPYYSTVLLNASCGVSIDTMSAVVDVGLLEERG
jgi:hypothetical protein